MAASDVNAPTALPPVLARVSDLVNARPEAFLSGDKEISAATLAATKYVFDRSLFQENRARLHVAHFLRSIEPSSQPQTRSQTRAATKRKRSPSPRPGTDEEIWRPTPLESLYLEGMDDDQVWAQLELRAATLCDILKVVLEDEDSEEDEDGGGFVDDADGDMLEDMEGMKNLESLPGDDEMDEDEDEEDESEDDGGDLGHGEGLGEDIVGLRDPSDEDSELEGQLDLDRPKRPQTRTRHNDIPGRRQGGHPMLDDGFFSLADFNAETEEAEAKDVSKGRLGQEDEADEDEDEDDAEDDVDLFAVVDVGNDTFEEDDLEDGGELYYKDFFAPPSHAKQIVPETSTKNASSRIPEKSGKVNKVRFHEEVRIKTIKSRGKGIPTALMKNGMMDDEDEDMDDEDEDMDDEDEDGDDEDSLGEDREEEGLDDDGDDDYDDGDDDDDSDDDGEDMMAEDNQDEANTLKKGKSIGSGSSREVIERLKDDLFAEDDERPSRDLSSHEARQAEIAAQIAKFEAENVAPKEWTLTGEANARLRPMNSLLEEDLEFERIMKVVPVVTEETVSSLEELIKKRILENNFDDVVRKQPVEDKPFLPSRVFELNDQKSAQSLAQIYEKDFTSAASGTVVDDRDGKLKKEHEDLEKLWESISYKLDALSNAHFTPKQPKVAISTVSNLAATTFESALPTTKSTTTMLAPEEIFDAPSELRSRDEMTPIEKRALRNKQRKARKKARDQIATAVDKFARTHNGRAAIGAVNREKKKALKSVVKTGKGVTVVGKEKAGLGRHNKAKQPITAIDGTKLKL